MTGPGLSLVALPVFLIPGGLQKINGAFSPSFTNHNVLVYAVQSVRIEVNYVTSWYLRYIINIVGSLDG